jgi:ribosomal protein S18 acetylase RimI-like enzyme
MIDILPMARGHCRQVAALHANNLPTPFKGTSGVRLLELYYYNIVDSAGGTGYVACNNNDVIGYVCGIWDLSSLRQRILRKYGLKLLGWGLVQILVNPGMMIDFSQRLAQKDGVNSISNGNYELRPIVVAPISRGTGIAHQLLGVLLQDASQRGYSVVCLITEKDNTRAKAFYEKSGFQQVDMESKRQDGYLRYEITLTDDLKPG